MTNGWKTLSPDYEKARAREDSLDRLMEWAAQRDLIGAVDGKDVLDVGCGNGEKAIELARAGARSVVGIDLGGNFLTPPPGLDVTLAEGDLSELATHPAVRRRFDTVVFLQSLGYAKDQVETLKVARELLRPDGVLVVARSHPIRYAVERAERDGIPLGDAYHSTEPYSYPSRWNPEVTLTLPTGTFSSMHNAFVEAGFWVDRVLEPQLDDELKARHPQRQAWLAKHLGIIVFRARPR
ncbi:class I SAM-dependent methyltransferase [Kribbella sp. DT2]|uniref:class I SAM-dependent methyltransferase n=1 Tax=Kribbella sp. DT2 TaxID=3393427 RepID=UPI003CECAE70